MNNEQDQNLENLKDIPKWTQKYAQNRTVPMLVSLAIFMLLFAGISLSSYFGGRAFISGNTFLLGFCIVIALVSMICLFITSIPKYGGRIISRISGRFYAREGSAAPRISKSMGKRKWLGYVVGLIFGGCIFASVILGGKGFFPIELMQPISAVYCVPFLLFLYFWQRPMVSPITLIWPALYAIHAILIVAGAPILFTGRHTVLNMLLPVAGYGLISGLIGHLYSRYALKKLKNITHTIGDTANGS